ncbi:MAG TPA: urease accessory UreF family protein [Flexivirga sp.]|uniref:urease accessory protein UreF n=1 Tax=Flexivirga sp. TaxID=1962927 RepID=UPI002C0F4366|nr:urease accessory UreF family protein [Flexivirga sp.]HWC24743.1 urease accessory UreF family protein [Flexivirga sp.]
MPAARSSLAALLLLGDGRLPSGGYAHSGGLEAVVRSAGVTDVAGLRSFLEGRAATAGYVGACFAAAACAAASGAAATRQGRISLLDKELDARMPSPTTREVSRSLGRQLLRALSSIHAHPLLETITGPIHQPVAYGVGAAAFELTPHDAAAVTVYESVAGPAAAAMKVLSTDPFTVQGAVAELAPLLDELAADAAALAEAPADELPSLSSPLLDIAAEQHRGLEARLFAS